MSASEDPEALASFRFARGAAIILGVLIVLALVALALGFAFRGKAAPAPGAAVHVALPEGARILSLDVVQGRVVLRIHSDEGDEVDIIDAESGRLVSQAKAPARGSPP